MGCRNSESFQNQGRQWTISCLLRSALEWRVLFIPFGLLIGRPAGQYPAAYKVHNEYCKATANEKLLGTCQLIPPQQEDYDRPRSSSRRHWIACLFTSKGYGKPTKKHPGVDEPDVILEHTRASLQDLKEQLLELENTGEEVDEDRPTELWSCKFNSGLFAVAWTDSKKVLQEQLTSLGKTVRVVSPARS
jgi:hypothetical protein